MSFDPDKPQTARAQIVNKCDNFMTNITDSFALKIPN